MEKVFNWRKSQIAYTVFGTGKLPLVALHGYGQDKSVFRSLVPSLGEHYTIYSFDLPYHGQTKWNERLELDYEDLEDLTVTFMKEAGINGMTSLMGYSIGGNYALALTYKCPHFVDELWLIASDGLEAKPGFNIITRTIAGRILFGFFILLPQPVFGTIRLLKRLSVLPDRVARFFMLNIDTRLKREMLYKRWRSVSRIRSGIRDLKRQIKLYNIPVYLIYGKNDGVIPVKHAIKFAQGLPSAHLVLTEQGHQMLEPETNRYIAEILNSKA